MPLDPTFVADALYDPEINLAVGASILKDLYANCRSWDGASSAFFVGNCNWVGADTVNGNTGQQYRTRLNELMATKSGNTTTTPAPAASPIFAPMLNACGL